MGSKSPKTRGFLERTERKCRKAAEWALAAVAAGGGNGANARRSAGRKLRKRAFKSARSEEWGEK